MKKGWLKSVAVAAGLGVALTAGTAHALVDSNDKTYETVLETFTVSGCTKDNHRVDAKIGVHPSVMDLSRMNPGLLKKIQEADEKQWMKWNADKSKNPDADVPSAEQSKALSRKLIIDEFLLQAGRAYIANAPDEKAIMDKIFADAADNDPVVQNEKLDEAIRSVGYFAVELHIDRLWNAITRQLSAADFIRPEEAKPQSPPSENKDELTMAMREILASAPYYSENLKNVAGPAAEKYEQKIEDATNGISVLIWETDYRQPVRGCLNGPS